VPFKGFYQPVVVGVDDPGDGAVFVERIAAVLGGGIYPVLRHSFKGLFAVMVGIEEMVRCFQRIYITLFIGAYGVLGNEIDISLIKTRHALWQRKNRQPVNTVMREETP
jgi:hypothetical protein